VRVYLLGNSSRFGKVREGTWMSISFVWRSIVVRPGRKVLYVDG
jgi:hypothetical protein